MEEDNQDRLAEVIKKESTEVFMSIICSFLVSVYLTVTIFIIISHYVVVPIDQIGNLLPIAIAGEIVLTLLTYWAIRTISNCGMHSVRVNKIICLKYIKELKVPLVIGVLMGTFCIFALVSLVSYVVLDIMKTWETAKTIMLYILVFSVNEWIILWLGSFFGRLIWK